ncbi:MAG: hypothetical protein J6Y98_02275 [Bacteroidales bacterium]|nr:hypothetical protein [Bacteroidales bacterium]
MSKTGSIILKCVLGILIVFLCIMIFLCVNRPQQRESEYFTRRDACGERLKVIRTLEEAHKAAYGRYCGDFDTLLINLHKQEQRVMKKEKAPNAPDSVYDMPELEAIRKGWIVQKEVFVVPIDKLREDKKLTLTDEQIAEVIYVPYTHKQTKFKLQADSVSASLSGAGDKLPTFEASVTLDELFADYKSSEDNGAFHKFIEFFTGSDAQWLINKKAELKEMDRFPGWKVGDINAPNSEGNFE